MHRILPAILLLARLAPAAWTVTAMAGTTPLYSYELVRTYPHDRTAFTQGLAIETGRLYEGTGRHGQSSLRVVELETGKVATMVRLHPRFFGEGVTVFADKLIQLTWKSRLGLVYDKTTLELTKTFRYPTEGWGLTHDGQHLILSDGSDTLYFLDPDSFVEVGRIQVRDQGEPVRMLNELEYVKGEIYANVWKSSRIARISPSTGEVTGWIELAGLWDAVKSRGPVDVPNGIAHDAQSDRLFVTGKLWPFIFEIRLRPTPRR